jgi:hypothetical protein
LTGPSTQEATLQAGSNPIPKLLERTTKPGEGIVER